MRKLGRPLLRRRDHRDAVVVGNLRADYGRERQNFVGRERSAGEHQGIRAVTEWAGASARHHDLAQIALQFESGRGLKAYHGVVLRQVGDRDIARTGTPAFVEPGCHTAPWPRASPAPEGRDRQPRRPWPRAEALAPERLRRRFIRASCTILRVRRAKSSRNSQLGCQTRTGLIDGWRSADRRSGTGSAVRPKRVNYS